MHCAKCLAISCSVLLGIIAIGDLAVCISWLTDGIDTEPIRIDYERLLRVLIILGTIAGFTSLTLFVGAVRNSSCAVIFSTLLLLATAGGFIAVAIMVKQEFEVALDQLLTKLMRQLHRTRVQTHGFLVVDEPFTPSPSPVHLLAAEKAVQAFVVCSGIVAGVLLLTFCVVLAFGCHMWRTNRRKVEFFIE